MSKVAIRLGTAALQVWIGQLLWNLLATKFFGVPHVGFLEFWGLRLIVVALTNYQVQPLEKRDK
jgi:hypothetical protein